MRNPTRLAIKVDVDTERGTREGLLLLAEVCRRHAVPATFFFSLGPDNMGKSIWRIFQPGFLGKVLRTRVASNYGWRTLLNGTLKPAPHLGRRFGHLMRQVGQLGFEAGVHCYDHYRWQNFVHRWPPEEVQAEFRRALEEFQRIFGESARAAAAPGWQCNAHSLAANDAAGLLFASDTRGRHPFRPRVHGQVFRTLQLPTTLPTLDELLGRSGLAESRMVDHYLTLLEAGGDHVHTVHAELEGLRYRQLFEDLLSRAAAAGIVFYSMSDRARELQSTGPEAVPVCDLELRSWEGRAGTLAVQAAP